MTDGVAASATSSELSPADKPANATTATATARRRRTKVLATAVTGATKPLKMRREDMIPLPLVFARLQALVTSRPVTRTQ
jgi:hypothetical protein